MQVLKMSHKIGEMMWLEIFMTEVGTSIALFPLRGFNAVIMLVISSDVESDKVKHCCTRGENML